MRARRARRDRRRLTDPATGQGTSIAFDNGGNVDPVLTYGCSASDNTIAALACTTTDTSAIVGDVSPGARVRVRVADVLFGVGGPCRRNL